jgi:hypothetical protein
MTVATSRLAACVCLLLLSIAPAVASEPTKPPAPDAALRAAASEQRLRLSHDGTNFSGPGWDFLLAEGRQAQFFAIGEEHGIAENPKFVAALFATLVEHDYRRLTIEVSPPLATALDTALHDGGLAGLHRFYREPGSEPAFYGMREEAELLASARSVAPDRELLWGTDYEVGGDRHLLRQLATMPKPAAAQRALDALTTASTESWRQYAETGSPQYIFSFSGDPALVTAVKRAWPERSDDASLMLDTLEETLEINKLWVSGQAWRSNERRAAFLRRSFLQHWQRATRDGNPPRVVLKFGASHVMRGSNTTDTFDIGSLLPALAALQGRDSFHLLVLPGAGASVARFNPVSWSYQPGPADASYARDLEAITAAAYPDSFTVIDLRPLRALAGMKPLPERLRQFVLGFDAVLVMSGSTASANLMEKGDAAHPAH